MIDIKQTAKLAYGGLYSTKEWKALRKSWLRFNCWCVYCQQIGIRRKATILDHIRPHRGNRALFLDRSNLQSLCKACHDQHKQRLEKSGKLKPAIGLDGWPCGAGGEGG